MEQESIDFDRACQKLFMGCVGALAAVMFCASPANAAGDAERGEVLYRGCQDCHSIEKNDVGPMHKGVVGRAAGTCAGVQLLADTA